MENIELQNDFLSVRINFKGAELSSIYNKKDSIEHVWQADEKVWGRHAPILFPIVGKVKGGRYSVNGKEYQLSQHGFARDKMFELDEVTKSKVVFKLSYDAESLKKYPFKFCLSVVYELIGGKINISYIVENKDNKQIWFSIGAHPGFTVPFYERESFEDYYLEFDKKENADKLLLSANGLLNGDVQKNFLSNSNIIDLKYSTFSKDALVFENLKSSYLTIKNRKNSLSLKIGIENFPLLGIWTMPGAKAPYICIEPWYGVADSESSLGDFIEKKAIESLSIGEQFEMNYFIEIS